MFSLSYLLSIKNLDCYQQSRFKQFLSFVSCSQASFSLAPSQPLVSLALKVVLGINFSLKEVVLGMKDEQWRGCLVPVASNLKEMALALSPIDLFDVSARGFTSLQDGP